MSARVRIAQAADRASGAPAARGVGQQPLSEHRQLAALVVIE
jgi:hypothetical protein